MSEISVNAVNTMGGSMSIRCDGIEMWWCGRGGRGREVSEVEG